jgi:hypothetical protein
MVTAKYVYKMSVTIEAGTELPIYQQVQAKLRIRPQLKEGNSSFMLRFCGDHIQHEQHPLQQQHNSLDHQQHSQTSVRHGKLQPVHASGIDAPDVYIKQFSAGVHCGEAD